MIEKRKLISILFVLALMIACLPLAVSADTVASGTCGDNLDWVLTSEGTLTISGTGDMYHYGEEARPWQSYIWNIKKVVIEDGVTSIGSEAFNGYSSIQEISIAASVTTIGYGAFIDTNIASVTIPEGVTTIEAYAFNYNTNLQTLSFPDTLETIGDNAFSDTMIKQVTIPATVTSIGSHAFRDCSQLTNVTFVGDAPVIGSNAFANVVASFHYPASNETWTTGAMQNYGGTLTWEAWSNVIASGSCGTNLNWTLTNDGVLTVSGSGNMTDYTSGNQPWKPYQDQITELVISEGVASISTNAFSYCNNLVSIEFPSNSLTSIGSMAFDMCVSLEEVVLPDSVTSVGSSCFAQCDSLKRIVLSDGMTSISSSICFDCEELVEVVLPAELVSVASTAFCGCDALLSVTLPATVTSVDSTAFSSNTSMTAINVAVGNTTYKSVSGVLFSVDGKTLYTYPAGIAGVYDIPEGTEVIKRSAFSSSTSLTAVTLPDSLKTVENYAFSNCTALKEIDLNQVVTVGDHALEYCKSMTTVTFGANLETLGDSLFHWRIDQFTPVKEIFFTGDVPSIQSETFESITSTVYYPKDNATWTPVVNANRQYGGTITWASYDPNATTGSGTLSSTINWELDKTGTLTITGTGAMPDFDTETNKAPWYDAKNYVKKIVVSTGITAIGEYNFYSCGNLTEVSLPEGLQSISAGAFYTSGLTAIVIPNSCLTLGDSVFQECANLSSVTLPENLTAIPGFCFALCSKLSSIDIPDTVTTLSDFALYGSGLTEVTLPAALRSCGDCALSACTELNSIDVSTENANYCAIDGVLYSADKETLLVYPAGRSGAYAVPEGTQTIAYAAFIYCQKLTNISFPNSLVTISNNAFEACSGLTELVLDGNIATLGNVAFRSCTSLERIKVSGKITTINQAAFRDCTALAEIELGDSVISIGNYAFRNCPALTKLNLGGNLRVVGIQAFRECKNLQEVVLGDKVTTVSDYAFFDCPKISKMVFGKSVTTVGSRIVDMTNVNFSNKYFYFTGNAPTIDRLAFTALRGYVYYPAGDSTWDSAITSRYNGFFTWVAHTHSYGSVVTAPTCTAVGYTTYTCECGDSYVADEVAALGHSFTNYVSDNNATVEKDGTKTAKCDNGCGTTDTVTDEGSKLTGAITLSAIEAAYDAEVQLWLKTIIPESFLADENAYVLMVKAGRWGDVETKLTTAEVKELGTDAQGRYILCQGVASGEMTSGVTFKFIDGNGNAWNIVTASGKELGTSATYSILDYAKSILARGTAKQKKMVTALLAYGGYAQKHFNVDEANPAYDLLASYNIEIPSMDAVTADTITQRTVVEDGKIGISAKNLQAYLDSAIYLRVYFVLDSGMSIDNYSFDLTYATVTGAVEQMALEPVAEGSRYYVDIEDIPAAYLDYMYKITVTNKTTGATYSVTTSVLVWIRNMLNSVTDVDHVNLLKAMYLYNQAANEFFNK